MDDLEAFLYHPVAAGMAGVFALVMTLLVPVGVGYLLVRYPVVALTATDMFFIGVGGMGVGIWLFNRVLYGTLVYGWIAEFMEWASAMGFYTPGGESA